MIEDELNLRRGRTHRAGKGRNRPQKPTVDHMAEANQHLRNAHADPTPQGTTKHLFKALGSLKRAQKGC